METKIIFEDSELLVLDKPTGMIVNRSDTTKTVATLQDWVEDYLKLEVSKVGSVSRVSNEKTKSPPDTSDTFASPLDTFKSRAGIVHRLDKETSGIILVAKTLTAFINLQAQFKERKVQKTYLALAHGKIEPAEGEINVAVGRLPWNRKRFGVLSGGRESVTSYKVLSVFSSQLSVNGQSVNQSAGQNRKTEKLSLVELSPKTGRTHQIRVHLQYVKHPIFADPLYAGRKTSRNDRELLPRVFLHASKISFSHPGTSELLSFESPLPEDLKSFLSSLSS